MENNINDFTKEKTVKIGCVIMASGLGKRFGGNKLMADLGGKPMIQWVLDVTDNIFYDRIVVTRNDEVKMLCEKQNIKVIRHEYPGRNDTVRLGLENMPDDIDGCMFFPGDQPLIKKESVMNMIENVMDDPERIYRLCHSDIQGMPVYFPSRFFEELKALPEGKGGGVVIRKHEDELMLVKISDAFELMDIDTKDDYNKVIKILGDDRLYEGGNV